FRAGWPLGYADDGASHRSRTVHSPRLPTPEGAPRIELHGVKVLHYALARPRQLAAKQRLYAVLENLHGTASLWQRRWSYSVRRDWTRNGTVGDAPESWFAGWEAQGIDMRTVDDESPSW